MGCPAHNPLSDLSDRLFADSRKIHCLACLCRPARADMAHTCAHMECIANDAHMARTCAHAHTCTIMHAHALHERTFCTFLMHALNCTCVHVHTCCTRTAHAHAHICTRTLVHVLHIVRQRMDDATCGPCAHIRTHARACTHMDCAHVVHRTWRPIGACMHTLAQECTHMSCT